MRLAVFDDYRVGVVDADGAQIRDVSDAVAERDERWPWAWMPRLVGDFAVARPAVEAAARQATPRSTSSVSWLPPIPWPGQLVAAAANYQDHAAEMAARPGAWT